MRAVAGWPLYPISPNLVAAFRGAASKILEYGFLPNAYTIADGAVADLARFRPVLDEAIKVRHEAFERS
jgi:hypothetical protein